MELYSLLKPVHVLSVLLSGAVFAGRGLLMIQHSPLTNHRHIRLASYGNDSLLLCSGIGLALITAQYPIAQAWLTVKLLLLPIYIVLGIFALRRGRSHAQRCTCLVAAIAVYLSMLAIAMTRNPPG